MERKIKLGDLIAYLGNADPMQIGIKGENDWDNCIELAAGSTLLKAYYDWDISEMGAVDGGVSVIRVLIKRPEP